MNERIKELSEQAQLYARQGMGKCVIELKRFDKDAVSERYAKDFEEKFAQLIVQECIGVVEGGSFLHDQAPTAIFARECSGAIKRHFGVQK